MPNQFQPGDVYFSSFPKFVQIPNKTDYNLDSIKPNATPRPVVVLEQISQNRINVAPISSDLSQNSLVYDTYVPILASNYPGFLKNNSFVKTNQIQTMETKWLFPNDASPIKVGQLNTIDLDRVRYFALYATQTEEAYARWISDIVTKNIKSVDERELKEAIVANLSLPERTKFSPRFMFKRGDVFEFHFQPIHNGPNDEVRISGIQKAIVMNDANYKHIPPGQVAVVPLLENKPENVKYATSLDLGVRLHNDSTPYRACVGQLQPMNRTWKVQGSEKGRINTTQMLDVDRAVVESLGMRNKVMERSLSEIQAHLKKMGPGRGR